VTTVKLDVLVEEKLNMYKEGETVGLFPMQADNNFHGYRIAAVVFLLVALLTLVRSCIHIFAPDGGASTIAGINTSVDGGSNTISVFALWGLA
jgi:hypothetical protein